MTIRRRTPSLRTAILLAGALAALSWTTVARAETAYLVRDIEPGNGSWAPDLYILQTPLFGGLPSQIVALGDLVVFAANERSTGFEPWVSDGTEAGTRLLADLVPGAEGSTPVILGVGGDQVLFVAGVGAGRQRLYRTDGTPEGTEPIDIPCDPYCGSVSRITGQFAGYLFFELRDGPRELLLYRSNGTAAGTVAVAGFCTHEPIGYFCFDRVSAMVSDHEKLVVVISTGTHFEYALRFDAPLAAPQPLLAGCSVISPPTLTRDTLLFFGRCGADVGVGNLYAADDGVSTPRWLGSFGLAYRLHGGAGSGALFRSNGELWRTDGSVSGTEKVEGWTELGRIVALGSGFILQARRSADGARGVFAVDERGEGQVLLVEGDVGDLVVSGDRVFFDADVGGLGLEPWVTEGTAETTRRLGDIAPGPLSSYPGSEDSDPTLGLFDFPGGFTVAGDRVFFDADDATRGTELWAALLDPESEPPSCVGEVGVLCLQGRFRAAVTWSAPGAGTGTGQPVALAANTGAFWFFGAQNLELIVKVVDGSELNGHHWVFYGGLTNVSFTLVVTDVVTGHTWTYSNTSGAFASGADTRAFPTDG